MTVVALVTPADASSPSVTAFQDEGNRFGWGGSISIYSPANAQVAHDEVRSRGGVLVAAGEMTATALQTITPHMDKIPIIVAYAGAVPANADTNMTGFIGDCLTIAKNHLNQLKAHGYNGKNITLLYDPEPTNAVTQDILKELLKIDNDINTNGLKFADIHGFTGAQIVGTGFMMIPNAVFFRYARVITDAVDNSSVELAYYPEFEYLHKCKKKSKAKFSGFNVPLTYRLAASWVDNLLTRYWTLDSMPSNFAQAIPDPYERWYP
jgi:hypothetical protein